MESFDGEIYSLGLEKNIGFTLIKATYVGPTKFSILTPLDILSDKEDFDKNGPWENCSPLCYDLLPVSISRRRPWRKIKSFVVDPATMTIPDFKNDLSSNSWRTPDWKGIDAWYLTRKLFPNGWTHVEYDKVSHLGVWQHSVPALVRTKLTMFWLKKLNKDMLEFYPPDELDIVDNFWKKAAYFETLNLTFYSDIDPVLWNRMKG